MRPYAKNPLSIPQYGAEGVVHPDVLYFPEGVDGYKYWLFYTPYPPNEKEVPCLVRSNDGLKFVDTGISNPLIKMGGRGAWDERWCADPDVVKIDDDWYLFYFGANMAYTSGAIGLATSKDGKKWAKRQTPIFTSSESWEGTHIAQPTVVYEEDKFWMWYVGYGTCEIGLASSEDAVNWARVSRNPVMKRGKRRFILGSFDSSKLWHPDVTIMKNKYFMCYCGENRGLFKHARARIFKLDKGLYQLGVAVSEDRVNWKKYEGNPILEPNGIGWQQRYIYRSSPTIVDEKMRLYYSAYAGTGPPPRPRIGLAWLEIPLMNI